jgi:hypothetical protein
MLAGSVICAGAWAKPAIDAVIPAHVPMGRDADILMQVKDGINNQFVIMPGGPFIKKTLPLPYRLYDMAVYEGFGLIAAGERGLLVADVAGTAAPKIVGGYSPVTPCLLNPSLRSPATLAHPCASSGKITRVITENDQAWVVDSETDIVVLHLANLAKPVVLGRYQGDRAIADVVVLGGYAYALLCPPVPAMPADNAGNADAPSCDSGTDAVHGCTSAVSGRSRHPASRDTSASMHVAGCAGTAIAIIDMRTPHAPVELSRTPLSGATQKIFVKGNHVYAAQPGTGLAIIDATDKAHPVQISRHAVTGGATAVTVQDNIALVARGVGGITVFDVADPAQVKWLGSHSRLGRVLGITAPASPSSPPQALVWNDHNEAITLDLTRPALPSIIAVHRDVAPVAAVWLDAPHENGMVVTATSSAVQIMDFSATPPLISNENLDTGQGVNFGGERRLFIDGEIAAVHGCTSAVSGRSRHPASRDTSASLHGAGCAGTAYVTDWFSGLHLYDISTPARPRLLSSFHTPGSAKGVVVRDGYAFVADDDHGLNVVDVRDPTRPLSIATLATNGLAYTPKLAGNLLYLASHRGGFQIIDVGNVASPKIIADVDTPGKSWSLDVAGNTLFVADDTSGILVFDVTDPAQPKQIGVFNPGGAAEDIVVRGTTAYATFFDQGFYVLDITNPAAPQKIGHTPTPGNARAIELKDNFAYVTDWFAGVQVIDISDNTAPTIVGEYDTRGAAWGIGIKGNYAYIGDWWGGFVTLDISNPHAPTLADHYHARGQILQIAAQGKFAYAVIGSGIENGSVQIFDITNPLNPTWVTGVDVDGAVEGLLLDGALMYLAVGSGNDRGVVVVDISNPFQARRINHIAIEDGVRRLRIGAGRLYFINAAGLGVISLGSPVRPQLLPGYAAKINDLWIDDKRIYLATDQGMEVLNVQLNVISRYKIVRAATLVRARGNTAFLYVAGLGIRVLNVAEGTVRPVSLFDPDALLSDLNLDNGVLYATGQDAHLLAIDITDLQRLKIQGLYPLARPATGITLTNNTALLAGNDIITSVKLLPAAVITRRDKKDIRLTLPKGWPAGTYHAVSIAANGKRSMGYNILNIDMPRTSKPKITPEEFQRLLQEQRKNLLQSPPTR